MVLIVSMWSQGASRNGLLFKRPFGSLCSYPSNAGIGISTWFEAGSIMESRKLVYKAMTYHLRERVPMLPNLEYRRH